MDHSNQQQASALSAIGHHQQQFADRYANHSNLQPSVYQLGYTYDTHVDSVAHQQPHQSQLSSSENEYSSSHLQATNSAVNLAGSANLSHWSSTTTKSDGYHPNCTPSTNFIGSSSKSNFNQAQAQNTISYYNYDDPAKTEIYYANQGEYNYTNSLYEQQRNNPLWLNSNGETCNYHYNSYNYYDGQQQQHHHQIQQDAIQDRLTYYQQQQQNLSSNHYDTQHPLYPNSDINTNQTNAHQPLDRSSVETERAHYLNGAVGSSNEPSHTGWVHAPSTSSNSIYNQAAPNQSYVCEIEDRQRSWSSDDSQSQQTQLRQHYHPKNQPQQQIKFVKTSPSVDAKTNPVILGPSGQRINQCGVCGRNYARPSTLKTHLRTHTNERPFKCGVCLKTFSQAANLTAHQRVHTGERPFSCPICGRQFSQSSSVITHLRTHSGERPYRCSMCSRTFSDSSTLTKHCRIHSGEKPYQCDHCPLNFSQSGNLSRHLKLHSMNGNSGGSSSSTGSSNISNSSSSSSTSSNGSSSNQPTCRYNGLSETQIVDRAMIETGPTI